MVFTRFRMILRSQSTFHTPFMELTPTKRRKFTKSMILRSEVTKTTKFLELPSDSKRISNKCTKSSTCCTNLETETETDPDPDPDPETKPASVSSPVRKIKKEPEPILPKVKKEELEVSIDFDDAHLCWMANKKKKGNGTYTYICSYILPNGKKCFRSPCDSYGIYSGCEKHYMWEEKLHNYESVYI